MISARQFNKLLSYLLGRRVVSESEQRPGSRVVDDGYEDDPASRRCLAILGDGLTTVPF